MSLAIGSADGTIEVCYAGQEVCFTASEAFSSTHTLLIKNAGTTSVRTLDLLYPACLIEITPGQRPEDNELIVRLLGVTDTTQTLRRERGFSAVADGEDFRLEYQDTTAETGKIAGYWRPGEMHVDFPEAVKRSPRLARDLFSAIGFTTWSLLLSRPLKPNEAIWWRCRIDAGATGAGAPGALGARRVSHEIRSPFDVCRRVESFLKDGLGRDWKDARVRPVLKCLEAGLTSSGLASISRRQVAWRHYDLTVKTGGPGMHFADQSKCEGNIQSGPGIAGLERSQGADGSTHEELVRRFRAPSPFTEERRSFCVRVGLVCADPPSPRP
jgi:hypothetical protein